MIYFVSGPVFVCGARAVNQQPPMKDGVTGAWGKGVVVLPPPPPSIKVLFRVLTPSVFEQN